MTVGLGQATINYSFQAMWDRQVSFVYTHQAIFNAFALTITTIAVYAPGANKHTPRSAMKVGNGHFVLWVVDPFSKEITYYDGLSVKQPLKPMTLVNTDVTSVSNRFFRYVKVCTAN